MIKGSSKIAGICDTGKTLSEMMNFQYVRMVFHMSSKTGSFTKSFQIDDRAVCERNTALNALVRLLDPDVDRQSDGYSGYYYNGRGFEGEPISKVRIKRRQMALKGEFPSNDYTKREEFFDAYDGLNHVVKHQCIDKETRWTCSCVCYWKRTCCVHTYAETYGNMDSHLDKVSMARRDGKQNSDRTVPMDDVKYVRGIYVWDKSGFETLEK